MSPLFNGPRVETPLLPGENRLEVAFGTNGNTFSNVEEAGVTVQVEVLRPANKALRGLTVSPCAFISLHASTMLCEQLPAARNTHPFCFPAKLGIATDVGTWSTLTSPRVVRKPS